MIRNRVPCNEQLENHSTVQVSQDSKVGLLGILNGFFGIKSTAIGFDAAVFEDDGEISRFEFVDSTYEDYFKDAND